MPLIDIAVDQQEVNVPNARPQSYWSGVICEAWAKSTAGIIETGRHLLQAREELDRDVFDAMRLPFRSKRTRERLMAIARHPVLSSATHVSFLPPSWGTLYELSRLPAEVLLARIEDGSIHPDMARKDAIALLREDNEEDEEEYEEEEVDEEEDELEGEADEEQQPAAEEEDGKEPELDRSAAEQRG